ncbi:MAG TPA: efflux transporter outer membrane subunit [Burkholderiales bacterium]|nr:efflux transporter outer membrane subunit [Burkholderiales bacterium]
MRRSVLALVAGAALAGCTVGPDYEQPVVAMPERWRIEGQQAVDIANPRWWEQFGDPALDRLIVAALRDNQDLLIAAARVDQFIGQLTATRSRFYPQIGYSADASSNRSSRVGQPPLAPGADPYYSLYQGAISADWQIDLFGRVRRQSEAAQAQVYASEQGRRGVILTLVTGVAASYIALRALDRQLEIARAAASNYGDTQQIFELRYQGGVVSQIELRQVESQYQQALAAIPSLELQVASLENLLSVLLGRNAGPIPRGRTIDELVAPAIPGGMPSSLLERRPDVLQAEQGLVAANANIGAARSLYFPTLSLTGVLGSVSTALGDFLTGPATAASLAAGLSGPIFTFGGISGQVDTAEAAQREALAFYQRTILQALRETNDALLGSVKKREEAEAQSKRVAALRDYARLSRLRFDNGYAGYLEVLYAENELFGAELTAVRSQAERFTQIVNVYQALGGGWIDQAGTFAPQPQLKAPPK